MDQQDDTLLKNLRILNQTNPQKASIIHEAIATSTNEKIEEMHARTSNSSLKFIEEAVSTFGEDNILELYDSAEEFGIRYWPTYELFGDEGDDIECLLEKIILHPDKEYPEKLEFVFALPYGYNEYEDYESKLDTDKYGYWKDKIIIDEDGFYSISLTNYDLEYRTHNDIVYFIIDVFKAEINEGMWNMYLKGLFENFMTGKTYVLSLEPSMFEPSHGTSLIIRCNKYPTRCYAYKEFKIFTEAMEFRENLFRTFFDAEYDRMKFSDEPSDVCSIKMTKEEKKAIVTMLNE